MKNFTRILIGTSLTLMMASTAHSQDVFNTAKVGIGTTNPAQKLEIGGNNTVRIDGLTTGNTFNAAPSASTSDILYANASGDLYSMPNGAAGTVLAIGATGIPTWTSGSTLANAWLLTGNTTAPVYGTNFIGFTSAVASTQSLIEFVTNGQFAGVIDETRANVVFGRGAVGDSTAASYSAHTNSEIYAIGAGALEDITTASAVVAIGYDALHNYTTGAGQGNGFSNNAVGALALYSLTTGIPNNALGTSAGYGITTGTYNVSVGFASNYNQTTGSYNVAAGDSALYGTSGAGVTYTANYNTAVGVSALSGLGTGTAGGAGGSGNTAEGYEALRHTTTGTYNVGVGFESVYNNTIGNYNVGAGYRSNFNNTTGTYNVGVGYDANYSNQTAYGNVAIGNWALYSNTYSGNTAVGESAMKNTNAGGAYVSTYAGGASVAVGDSTMYANTGGVQDVAVGWAALTSATGALASNDTNVGNVAVGYTALEALTNGQFNTGVGNFAMVGATNASYCVAVGLRAVEGTTPTTHAYGDIGIGDQVLAAAGLGNYDIAIGGSNGEGALQATTGSFDIGIGYNAADGGTNLTSGNYDIAIGTNTTVGTTQSNNTAIGVSSTAYGTTGNTNNTALGYSSTATGSSNATAIGEGTTASGANSTALGAGASASASNATAIGASTAASTANTVILGQTATATSVGIGTTAPARLLEVAGTTNTVRIDGLQTGGTFNSGSTTTASNILYANNATGDVYSLPNGTNGYVLTMSSGVPTWAISSSLTGVLPITVAGGNVSISGTNGGVAYATATTVGFTVGASGYVLEGQGAGNAPIWTTLAALAGSGDGWGSQVAITDSNVEYPTEGTISGDGLFASPLRLAQQGASTGQVLAWSGTTWKPSSANASLTTSAIANGGGSSVVVVTNGTNQVVGGSNALIDVQGGANEVLYGQGTGTSAIFTTGGSVNQVLELNGSGVPTWTTLASGSGWNLTGNAGTVPGTNFIGTTDDNSLLFGVNGAYAGSLDALNNNYTGANVYLGGPSTSSPVLNGAGNKDAGDNNVAVGLSAMGSAGGASWQGNSTDNTGTSVISGNVAVGVYALSSAVYGGGNTALGAWSQRYLNIPTSATTSGNTSGGAYSLYSNSTGTYNTALGYKSMYGSGSATAVGNFNTALGYQSLYTAGAGIIANTAIGSNALLNDNNNGTAGHGGNQNTAVGDSALYSNTSGEDNTALGYQANVSSGTLTNATAIGYQASAPVSNSVTLGNSSVASLYLPGYTAVGDILYTSAGTGQVGALTPGASGTVLASSGAGVAPTWISVSGINSVTGTPPIYSSGGSTPNITIQGLNANEGGVLYSAGTGNNAAFTATGTSGYVLESQGTGAPIWVNPSAASGWSLTGNSGTVPGTNYLGTLDDNGLYFEVNGAYAGGIDALNNNYTGANVYLGGASTSSPVLPGAGNIDAGDNNVAVGLSALSSAGGGSWQGSAAHNTGVSVISGNVAVGVYALSSAVYGGGNTALGAWSQRYLNSPTSGSTTGNTAAGAYSLYSNSTGIYNTAVGYKSMYGSGSSTAVGSYNTALGYNSLYTAGVGEASNTAIGTNAAYNTATSKNTAVGDSALVTNTTGTDNTALGYDADVSLSNLSNATVIGYGASALTGNSITLGNSSANSLYLPGYGSGTTIGDILYTSTATGLVANLTPGAAGTVLASTGTSSAPTWISVAGISNVTATVPIYSTGGATPVVSIQGLNTNEGGVLYSAGTGNPAAFSGTGTSGNFLESQGTLPPIWAAPSAANAWSLTGNTISATYGTNYIGTSAATEPIQFRVNNTYAGLIDVNASNIYFGQGTGGDSTVLNTVAGQNVAIGWEALASIPSTTNAGQNAAIGAEALHYNTAGSNNAVGYGALHYNTTGTPNDAFGYEAGFNNTTGANNLAVGFEAAYYQTTGSDNVAVGDSSLYGPGSTYVGNNNTALGVSSLLADNGGAGNTAAGYESSRHVTTGGYNSSVGYQAGYSNTTGYGNVAMGYNSLKLNTASDNVAVGTNASLNTTGAGNTAVGDSSLYTNTSGTYNTAVGYQANVTSSGLTNATAIGNGAIALANNSITLGNSSATALYLPGYINVGDILYTANASGLVQGLVPGASGTVLESTGSGSVPTWIAVAGANSVAGAAPIYITGSSSTPTVNIEGLPSGTDAGGVLYSAGAGNPAAFTPTGTLGQVLQSNGTGIPTWVTAPAASNSWLIAGNAGTTPGTNYIGTSGTSALEFKVDAVPSGWLDYVTNDNAYFGYGTGGGITSPSAGGDYGTDNVAMGYETMGDIPSGAVVTATEAIGAYAMYAATAATSNVAFGVYSQYYNSGSLNTSVGSYALYSNQAGSDETALGYNSMYGSGTAGTMGSFNTAVGYESLYKITTGGANTAVGSNALLNTTGGRNTAVGDSALASNTTGEFNTAVGYQALATNANTTATLGTYNTALGYDANVGGTTITNATAIGAFAYANQSNTLVLGGYVGNGNGATANTNVAIGTNAPATDAGLAIKTLHLESQAASTATSATANGNAGTSASAVITGGAGAGTTGTDVGGAVTITEGTAGWAAGTQVTVNFANVYINAPTVIITAGNAATGAIMGSLQPYVAGTSTTGFTIGFTTAASSNTAYQFNYFVIETK